MTDKEIDQRFGNFIRDRRIQLNWGWYKAASNSGLSYTRIQSLERGTSHKGVTKHECELLSQGYGITLNTLLRMASGQLEVA